MELHSPDYKEMQIPIGVRKKFENIKKNLTKIFNNTLNNMEENEPSASFVVPAVIESIPYKALPGSYPKVIY